MEKNKQVSNLVDYIVGEIAKSEYLSTPNQFNDFDTEFQKGRLSVLNEMIDVLMNKNESK